MNTMTKPLFPLGQVVQTANFQNTVGETAAQIAIARHQSGDWGDLCPDDAEQNNIGLKEGGRLFSVYAHRGTKFWVITEHDRSVTTLLLPEDY